MRKTKSAKYISILTLILGLLSQSPYPYSVRGQASNLNAQIRRGRLAGGSSYMTLMRAKYGTNMRMQPGNRIAAKASPGSHLIQVGDPPSGFGKVFEWDRKDNELALTVYVYAADAMGVSITGLAKNDIVQITSASGIATFSKDQGNSIASSIIGLLAVGADAALIAKGGDKFLPVVDKAEAWAKDQFKGTNQGTDRRDPFGLIPDNHTRAQQEGGIIVCLPEAGGPYYSGNDDNRSWWIQGNGFRDYPNSPKHIPFASDGLPACYFPIQGDLQHNTRKIVGGGELYITPWDFAFDDNAGFYKVQIHIKKGDDTPVILK